MNEETPIVEHGVSGQKLTPLGLPDVELSQQRQVFRVSIQKGGTQVHPKEIRERLQEINEEVRKTADAEGAREALLEEEPVLENQISACIELSSQPSNQYMYHGQRESQMLLDDHRSYPNDNIECDEDQNSIHVIEASMMSAQSLSKYLNRKSILSRESGAYRNVDPPLIESNYSQAETIVRNLVAADEESIVEVDQAIQELEQQQIGVIRQVIQVQIRRMLTLLQQIKVTQSQRLGKSNSQLHLRSPEFLKKMVQTCAEAILINIIPSQNNNNNEYQIGDNNDAGQGGRDTSVIKQTPETELREALDKTAF